MNGSEWKLDRYLCASSTAENCLQMVKTSAQQHRDIQESILLSESVLQAIHRFDLPNEIPFFEYEARNRIRNETVEWMRSDSMVATISKSISILQQDVFPSKNEDLVVSSSWSCLMVELAFAGYSQEMQYVSNVLSNVLLYWGGGDTQTANQKIFMAIHVEKLASRVKLRRPMPSDTGSRATCTDQSRVAQLLKQTVSTNTNQNLPKKCAADDLQTLSQITAGAFAEMSGLVAPTACPTADIQTLLEISSLASRSGQNRGTTG
jgi:hypothetical protein